jgi:SAM-dependent methyltransferase
VPLTNTTNPNFDPIAHPYRWLEYLTLGPTLQRCRLHHLPKLLQQKSAFILGDGDGRFLARLLAANPSLQVDAVDTSKTMLQLLRRHCEEAAPTATRLHTHHTSALSFTTPNPEKYDLVVTHFFLDCLTQPVLEALISRTVPTLTPNALWLLSDFRIPPGLMGLPARLFVRALYLAFRLLTGLRTIRLPDHSTALNNAGLTRISSHYSLAGLLTTELWQRRESYQPSPEPDPPEPTFIEDLPYNPL